MSSWIHQKLDEIRDWARASSLRYYLVRGVCCGDEFAQTVAARYDLERFGARPEADHRLADVLIIIGTISQRAASDLERLYQEMPQPRWVMAVGTCACSGGVFSPECGGAAIAGISSILPVDVLVPGCPPRPEAIIDGWIALQNKIRRTSKAHRIRRRRQPRENLEQDWGSS